MKSLRSFTRPHVNLYPQSGETGHIRSLPELVDYNAMKNGSHLFCLQARRLSAGSPVGYLEITNLQFKHAISRCAAWLKLHIRELVLPYMGERLEITKGPPVALLMTSDIGLLLYQFALMSLGVPVLLLSTRLNPIAVHHLLEQTSADVIITSRGFEKAAKEALSLFREGKSRILYHQIPYAEFLPSECALVDPLDPICHKYHFIGEHDTTALILHSSGTTGLPKPIFLSHTHLMSYIPVASELDTEKYAKGCNINTMPLFHGYGVLAVTLAMGIGVPCCIAPVSMMADAVDTIRIIKQTGATSLMTVPSILEEVSLLPPEEGADVLAELDFVLYGGAIMKESVGDFLAAKGVRMINQYGSAEVGCPCPIRIPELDHDWRFFTLRSDMKMQIDEVDSDNGERQFQLTMYRFGHKEPFVMQDRLISNPKHPYTQWTAVGRSDDLIVLSTGEKVNPHQIENLLNEHSSIKAAVAFGENRFELGLLVQPVESIKPSDYENFIQSLWPTIARVNESLDSFARILSLDAVAIVPTYSIIPRTDKRSIARREVYQTFSDTIDRVYLKMEDPTTNRQLKPLDPSNYEDGIKDLVQNRLLLRNIPVTWSIYDDLFELGMDSLQATLLRRLLITALPEGASHQKSAIGRDFVYTNPSVAGLANALRNVGKQSTVSITDEINRYTNLYSLESNPGQGHVVILTGATGSLGAYCLDSLTRRCGVTRVICLNRSSKSAQPQTARERQADAMRAKGIELTDEQWSKITVYQTSLASPSLGLAYHEYSKICSSATHILHTAWPLDFKRHLRSFESAFKILHNLLTLSLDIRSLRPCISPRLLFTSSIATVGQYTDIQGTSPIPEAPFNEVVYTSGTGYSQAKFVCERIIDQAVARHGSEFEASYVRIGQLSGSTRSGFWSTSEYFPAIIKSSQHINVLPDLQGTFSWTPVDAAADVLSDLLLLSGRRIDPVYHLENPRRQPWGDVMRIVSSSLGITDFLPFCDWLKQVECHPMVGGEAQANRSPARQLIDFLKADFERWVGGGAVLGTEVTQSRSRTFRNLDSVATEHLSQYLDYWKRIVFLSAADKAE